MTGYFFKEDSPTASIKEKECLFSSLPLEFASVILAALGAGGWAH